MTKKKKSSGGRVTPKKVRCPPWHPKYRHGHPTQAQQLEQIELWEKAPCAATALRA